MIKPWQRFRSAMTCVRTLELKCSNRGTGVTCSELKFLTGAQRASVVTLTLEGQVPISEAIVDSLYGRCLARSQITSRPPLV
jgi:hypothetical protein